MSIFFLMFLHVGPKWPTVLKGGPARILGGTLGRLAGLVPWILDFWSILVHLSKDKKDPVLLLFSSEFPVIAEISDCFVKSVLAAQIY